MMAEKITADEKEEVIRLPEMVDQPVEENISNSNLIDGRNIIKGTIKTQSLSVGNQFWAHNLTWTSTDADTVSWSSGTLTFTNGDDYSISSGNTGNMAARTYIYFDKGVSQTVLQTSTTYSDAIGDSKALLAVAQNATSGAIVNPVFSDGTTISGNAIVTGTLSADRIAAGSITGGKIAASTITGDNISSLNLTTKTLTADTGTVGGWTMGSTTLTGGAVTLSSSGIITGGTIRTSSGNDRVQLSGSTDRIDFYNGGFLRGYIRGSTIGNTLVSSGSIFTDSSGDGFGAYAASGDYFKFYATGGNGVIAAPATETILIRNSAETVTRFRINTDGSDAGLTTNSGYLLIGTPTSTHIAIDNNEIMAKNSGTTASPLYLNQNGSDVWVGNAMTYGCVFTGTNSTADTVSTLVSEGPALIDSAATSTSMGDYSMIVSDNLNGGGVLADYYLTYSDYCDIEPVAPDFQLSDEEMATAIADRVTLKYEKSLRIKEELYTDSKEFQEYETNIMSKDIGDEVAKGVAKKRVSQLEVGTVVAITDDGIVPTSTQGQTNIIGVVSGEPGFVAGEDKDGIAIAKFGNAKVFVIGKCSAGDLLQCSDTPGHAEASVPDPVVGSVIGRAKVMKESLGAELIEVSVALM